MKLKDVTRLEQLNRLRQRSAGRGKQGKARLLDELCEQFGYSRKHAIKLMRPIAARRSRHRSGPPQGARGQLSTRDKLALIRANFLRSSTSSVLRRSNRRMTWPTPLPS